MSRRLFLERQTYRRSRLEDAARLMPILGMFLFFGPVFILTSETGVGAGTSGWMLYFLVVWAVLIALTAIISRALARSGGEGAEQPPPGDDGGTS